MVEQIWRETRATAKDRDKHIRCYGKVSLFFGLTHEISVHGAFVSFFTSLIFREMDVYKYFTGESKLDLGSAHGRRITLPSRRLIHVRSTTFEIGSLRKSPQSRRGQNVSICFSVGVHILVYVCLESQKPISKKHASASLGFVLFVWI
jgi:hypothetical protein